MLSRQDLLPFVPSYAARIETSRRRARRPHAWAAAWDSVLAWYRLSLGMSVCVCVCGCVSSGLACDRQWMVVDQESGRFMSQRTDGKMALVRRRHTSASPLSCHHPRTFPLLQSPFRG